MRALLALLALVAGTAGGHRSADLLRADAVRAPDVRTNMDNSPANLASAVVTYNFGLLPAYIDEARYRLLPHDLLQTAEPGKTRRRAYSLTVPRTKLVLDTAVASAQTESQVREDAGRMRVFVSLDRRALAEPERYWVFYRNDGPEICRIYFPNDLGSLNMGANSLVLNPLPAGRHVLHVVVRERLAGAPADALIVSDYLLQVLPRGPNRAERLSSPNDNAPKPADRTPLTLRSHV